MKRFAISDIHGCVKTFKALLQQIQFSKEDILYLLGDYIDRGPDSKGVIDHIWKLQSSGFKVICLKGNHEQMMLDALGSLKKQRHWLMHGGSNTVESFDIDDLSKIPKEYIDWLQNLIHHQEIDGFILVHAGLNFTLNNPLEDSTAMLWSRNWYTEINRSWLGDRIIIHGHTPIEVSSIKQHLKDLNKNPVIDIDAGCCFERSGLGNLCALDLDSKTLYFQANIDR